MAGRRPAHGRGANLKERKEAEAARSAADQTGAAPQGRQTNILLNYTIGISFDQFAKIAKKEEGIFTIPEKKKNFRKWSEHNIYTEKKKWYSNDV